MYAANLNPTTQNQEWSELHETGYIKENVKAEYLLFGISTVPH